MHRSSIYRDCSLEVLRILEKKIKPMEHFKDINSEKFVLKEKMHLKYNTLCDHPLYLLLRSVNIHAKYIAIYLYFLKKNKNSYFCRYFL